MRGGAEHSTAEQTKRRWVNDERESSNDDGEKVNEAEEIAEGAINRDDEADGDDDDDDGDDDDDDDQRVKSSWTSSSTVSHYSNRPYI